MRLTMAFAISSFLSFAVIGCGSVTIDIEGPTKARNSYDEYYDTWWFGFVNDGQADVAKACPDDRVASLRNYFSTEDILLAGLTLGIYTPHTTRVTCSVEAAGATSAN